MAKVAPRQVEVVPGRSRPVLVIGMHRSGTRLLADVLAELGIFMGADRQADAESISFMLLNEQILHQCGAFWSEPMAAHFLLAQPENVAQIASVTADSLSEQLAGYRGSAAHNSGVQADAPQRFGWKDPRNTFTLPVWRHLFPQLKAIHLLRHGVDAAASLARRHAAALRSATGQTVPEALTVIQDRGLGILSSRRGWTLAEALTMWEQYVEKARLEASELKDNLLEVRFERLLEEPVRTVAEIAGFCEVPDRLEHADLTQRLDAQRAYAYRRNASLVEFAESQRAVLERFGYAP